MATPYEEIINDAYWAVAMDIGHPEYADETKQKLANAVSLIENKVLVPGVTLEPVHNVVLQTHKSLYPCHIFGWEEFLWPSEKAQSLPIVQADESNFVNPADLPKSYDGILDDGWLRRIPPLKAKDGTKFPQAYEDSTAAEQRADAAVLGTIIADTQAVPAATNHSQSNKEYTGEQRSKEESTKHLENDGQNSNKSSKAAKAKTDKESSRQQSQDVLCPQCHQPMAQWRAFWHQVCWKCDPIR
ncbi:hypothetical protein S40285_10425 [Stachybotrys chlorohalonatus IBT 40285]|uniref:Uncharacterized protein n=1 Tax=Stachybotrys chlorohalonatus (strain IBT 40285) TaxID=1283841 RepID=A0A084QMH8_STAC4|nr:hypothetical protein S40285_10425 [Stachybotrys chlorohalonata IBT 40285]